MTPPTGTATPRADRTPARQARPAGHRATRYVPGGPTAPPTPTARGNTGQRPQPHARSTGTAPAEVVGLGAARFVPGPGGAR